VRKFWGENPPANSLLFGIQTVDDFLSLTQKMATSRPIPTPTIRCHAVGLEFLNHAPYNYLTVGECNVSSDIVFRELVSPDSWPKWFQEMRSVVYTSPEPFGVGTTRTVAMKDFVLGEYFLAWEQNKRFCFRFESQNSRVFDAGVEDIQLEDLPGGRTRITYRVAMQPAFMIRLCGCIVGFDASMKKMFDRAMTSFVHYLDNMSAVPNPTNPIAAGNA
jgi:uncharacterized protein YndB with AHSA1/START domain